MADSGGLMYEPSYPPTIPPGQTIDDWRRSRTRQRRQRGWRIATNSLAGLLGRRTARHRGGQR
jgi:hypothetical protein